MLHRLAIRWWQGVYGQVSRLPAKIHPAIEPEAILLNVFHHALAADEPDLAGQTRIALEVYEKHVLPTLGDVGRLARLQQALAAAAKLAHDAGSLPRPTPPIGLEKAGYRIQMAAGGAFAIVAPPNAPARFPMQAFCETLESFHHAGPGGNRLVDKLMAALVPQLKHADQLDSLEASFTKIYGNRPVGKWRYALYQFAVVHAFDEAVFDKLSLAGSLFSLPPDDVPTAFHALVAAIESVTPEEKKVRLLKRLIMELGHAPPGKLRELRTALVEVVIVLKADMDKVKLLSRFLERDLFKSAGSRSRFFDILQSVYLGLRNERARIKMLSMIAAKPFRTPVAASDASMDFVMSACAHIDDEAARASILSTLAFMVVGYQPERRGKMLPLLREASRKLKDAAARQELEDAISEYFGPAAPP